MSDLSTTAASAMRQQPRWLTPLALMAVAVPWVPSPNVGGLGSVLSPLVAAIMCAVGVLVAVNAGARVPGTAVRPSLILICIAIFPIVAALTLRIVEARQGDEIFLVSRLVLVAGAWSLFILLSAARQGVWRICRGYLLGMLAIGVLVIVVGISGIAVFDNPSPPRVYGVSMPFFKTTGVERSYGEFAIMTSAAVAILLVFRSKFRAARWWGALGCILMAVFVSQSRTGFLSLAIVLAVYIVLRRTKGRGWLLPFLGLVLSFSLWAESLFAAVADLPFVSSLLGEGILEENVSSRLSVANLALASASRSDLAELLFGISREEWIRISSDVFGVGLGVHNHVLSSFLYFGLLGGGAFLVIFFIAPCVKLVRAWRESEESSLAYLLLVSSALCLQFYEGFYSLALLVQTGIVWYVAWGRTTSMDPATDQGNPSQAP